MPKKDKKAAPRARSIECPECGKKFTPQGIAGHLRMAHGVESEKANQLTAELKQEAGVAPRTAPANPAEQPKVEGSGSGFLDWLFGG